MYQAAADYWAYYHIVKFSFSIHVTSGCSKTNGEAEFLASKTIY